MFRIQIILPRPPRGLDPVNGGEEFGPRVLPRGRTIGGEAGEGLQDRLVDTVRQGGRLQEDETSCVTPFGAAKCLENGSIGRLGIWFAVQFHIGDNVAGQGEQAL